MCKLQRGAEVAVLLVWETLRNLWDNSSDPMAYTTTSSAQPEIFP